jgi:hypothetical protein
MLRLTPIALLATVALSTPAMATVLGEANVSLGTTPKVFSLKDASFGFTFDPALAAAFDPAPYSVVTTGTGQTSAFGGFLGIPLEPSPFDTSGIFIDGNLFPSYASFTSLSSIPYSLVTEDLALRYMVGADYYYGYARLNGDGTLNIAFEDQANTGITAGAAITAPFASGAVPEPATWAMMLLGFAGIGLAFRRGRKPALRPMAI